MSSNYESENKANRKIRNHRDKTYKTRKSIVINFEFIAVEIQKTTNALCHPQPIPSNRALTFHRNTENHLRCTTNSILHAIEKGQINQ